MLPHLKKIRLAAIHVLSKLESKYLFIKYNMFFNIICCINSYSINLLNKCNKLKEIKECQYLIFCRGKNKSIILNAHYNYLLLNWKALKKFERKKKSMEYIEKNYRLVSKYIKFSGYFRVLCLGK